MPMCLRKTALRYTAPDMKHNSLPETPSYPEVRTGQSIAMLKALHILTRDGRMNQDSRRKLKQVYHLYQFIEPLLARVLAIAGSVQVADIGAGKSYLGFILYDLFLKPREDASHVYAIEARSELVRKATTLAAQLSFSRMPLVDISSAPAQGGGTGGHAGRSLATPAAYARVRQPPYQCTALPPAGGERLSG